MKKKDKSKIWIAAMVFMALMVTSVFAIGIVSATTWYVEEGESIQAAVDAAKDGDTIIVRDGIYVENVNVNKRLTIKSENGSENCIVEAEYFSDHVFEVKTNYVNISGFTVKGATSCPNKAGIYLAADHCIISNNNCSNNLYGINLWIFTNNNTISNNNCSLNYRNGILLWFSNNNNISNNNFYSNYGGGIHLGYSDNSSISNNDCLNNDFGIGLGYSDNNNISDNNCSNNDYGVYLEYSNNNTISNNNCFSNSVYGIPLVYSSKSKLTGNILAKNGIVIFGDSLSDCVHEIDESNRVNGKPVYYWEDVEGGKVPDGAGQVILANCKNVVVENQDLNSASVGIEVAFSSYITIKNNNCSNNWWTGICLGYSNNNSISNNICSNNLDGISISHSNNNIISNNNYSNNEYGISPHYSNDSVIWLNNFINNTYNVDSYNSTNIWNSTSKIIYIYNGSDHTNYLGNYWSDYTDVDANDDGIWDNPRSIDSHRDYHPLVEPFENYPAPTPALPPTSGKGIWIWHLSEAENGNVSKIIEKVKFAGLTWVTIKCGDGNLFWKGEDECTSDVVTQFHNAGIKVFGWQYVYGDDPIGEAEVANQILDLGIDGFIIDAEAEYKGKPDNATAYLENIREEHPVSFVAYTTFPIIDYHTDFPYLEFGKYCDAVMPQDYWKEIGVTPEEMVEWMEEQWNKWHEIWEDGGHSDSVKPIIPLGQGWDVSGSEITRFCNLVYAHGYGGVSLWRYGTMTEANWEAYEECFAPQLTITAYSPVDIVATGPDGLSISKQSNKIPGASYTEFDMNGDGDPDDEIIILYRKIGNYLISVIPEPDANLTDTYTLELSTETTTTTLAENVSVSEIPTEPYVFESTGLFDTGSPKNPYPSIMGNHTGTIKPNHTVIATKIYTYSCTGTGGHTEYAKIRNLTWNATATWEGYVGDWHNITFDKTVVLLANETYNYTIRTGSYPQIIHKPEHTTLDGSFINCTKFIDANGKEYTDWIPAIRLE